jgi:nitroreductase
MMETFKSILSRRSIRRYTGEKIGSELIQMVLEAGMAAPSAGNQQPWHFMVLDDRNVLDAVPEHHPHSSMIREAPIAILVCGDISVEKHQGYWVQDCAAATENMLVAVTALGLGAVWLGVYPREDRVQGLKGLLGLPDHIIPFSLIPVGRPAEEKPPAGRYDTSRVHYNRW